MAKITRLGFEGYGVRRAGNFSRAAVISGTLAVTETADIAAILGTVIVAGTLAVTEASDVASIVGSIPAVISGTLAVVDVRDAASIVGTVPLPPIEHILNGESGFSVRAKLNALIDIVNDLNQAP